MRSNFSGGQAARPPIINAPPVVIWSVVVIIVIYLIIALLPKGLAYQVEFALGLTPARFAAGPEANGGLIGMIRPLFSTIIVHGSLSHLVMNSIWLVAFGAPVASRFGAGRTEKGKGSFSGAAIFLLFFALSGAAGALVFTLFHLDDYTLLVGASGGISGLLGAIIRFGLRRPAFFTPGPQPLLPLLNSSVIVASFAVIALNVGIEVFGNTLGGANVAWEAHIGGYLFGLVSFPLFEAWSRMTRSLR